MPGEGGNKHEESIFEFIDRVLPEFDDAEQIDGWSEAERDIADSSIALVRLDPVVAEMNREQFLESVANSGEESVFEGLIEFYPRDNEPSPQERPNADDLDDLFDGTGKDPRPEDGVVRVTGRRVENPPKYYAEKASGIAGILGQYSRSNWVVGIYEDGLYDKHGEQYISSYMLFDGAGTNRSDEIRRSQSVLDWIGSEDFDRFMDEIREMSEEERQQFIDDLEDG